MGIITGELFYDMMEIFCYYFVDEVAASPSLSQSSNAIGAPSLAYSDNSHVDDTLVKSNADGYVDHSVRVNMGIQDLSSISTRPFFPSSMMIRERMNRHSIEKARLPESTRKPGVSARDSTQTSMYGDEANTSDNSIL